MHYRPFQGLLIAFCSVHITNTLNCDAVADNNQTETSNSQVAVTFWEHSSLKKWQKASRELIRVWKSFFMESSLILPCLTSSQRVFASSCHLLNSAIVYKNWEIKLVLPLAIVIVIIVDTVPIFHVIEKGNTWIVFQTSEFLVINSEVNLFR